ncbi:MAG: hypothetical protein KDC10_06285 [Calditrichaeota bacterium]|nr:hypothetical protein [Candidatus Cloacimonadota bacterium]MCB1046793.1 hypothetical protein [Calditrichota bacterium]
MASASTSAAPEGSSRPVRILLWVLAVLLMAAAVVYQRTTGPTYPKKGEFQVAGQSLSYRLVRSENSTIDAAVILPQAAGLGATLYYKRYKLDEPYTALPLQLEDQTLVARLPRQPAAGKLEYYLELTGSDTARIPAGKENVVIRYKDPVPGWILIPHIFMMFFSVLIGMRTGLAAIAAPDTMRRTAWITLIGLTIGGMMLGPLVQKYAFGAFWTGFPYGKDLTDNKMLIMWLAWVFACSVIGFKPKAREAVNRIVVLAAMIVMTAVYLIPHSMRGSELDYSKLEQGVAPHEAIGTSTK